MHAKKSDFWGLRCSYNMPSLTCIFPRRGAQGNADGSREHSDVRMHAGILPAIRNLLAWLIVLLFSESAACFDRVEHQTVADAAYYLAAAQYFHAVKVDTRISKIICGFLREDYLLALQKDCSAVDPVIPLSYGEISACVDNVESAIRLRGLADSGVAMPWPGTAAYVPVQRSLDSLKTACENRLKEWTAATNNETHFQTLAVESFRAIHDVARQRSRDTTHLSEAIVAGAIADHFLLDLHAPGHELAIRTGSHDTIAFL